MGSIVIFHLFGGTISAWRWSLQCGARGARRLSEINVALGFLARGEASFLDIESINVDYGHGGMWISFLLILPPITYR